LPGAERVVPAKIFEYLATRKPILAISRPGEVWDILRDYPAGAAFSPSDTDGTVQWLASQLLRHERREPTYLNGWDPSRFGRDRQARQLANILDSLIKDGKGSRESASGRHKAIGNSVELGRLKRTPDLVD
jgi:hypothetical protein